MLNELLSRIRLEDNHTYSVKQKIIQISIFFAVGLLLGVVIKLIEGVPHYGRVGDLLNTVGNIFSDIGIWILMGTLISSYSKTPKEGAIQVLVFLVGMLITYYIYSMKLFGFFPTYYFIRWGLIALISPLAGYVMWFSRGNGWLAALCASLPIGLLISRGYAFTYTYSVTIGFNLFGASILLVVLPISKDQLLKILPFTILIALVLSHWDVFFYLVGGL